MNNKLLLLKNEVNELRTEVRVAKKALKEADEAVLMTIRAAQEPFNNFWLNFDLRKVDLDSLDLEPLDLENINPEYEDIIIAHRMYLNVGQAVSKTDAGCIAAEKTIKHAQAVQRTAKAVLKDKQALLKAKQKLLAK